MRKLIVDGYNLAGECQPHAAEFNRPQAGKELIPILEAYALQHPAIEVTVVFDAESDTRKRGRRRGSLRVVYASRDKWGDQPADECIADMVMRESEPQACIVVTSDKRLADVVRRRKAHCEPSKDFADTLRKMMNPRPELPAGERPVESSTWDEEKRKTTPLKGSRPLTFVQQHHGRDGSLSVDAATKPGAIVIRWSNLLAADCALSVFATEEERCNGVNHEGSIGRDGQRVLTLPTGTYAVVISGHCVYLECDVRLADSLPGGERLTASDGECGRHGR